MEDTSQTPETVDTPSRQALLAIATASRDLADRIEALLGPSASSAQPAEAARSPRPGRKPIWDPEVDPPLVPPKVAGTRQEQDWCSLTYLGGIYAINKRHDRGATRDEVRRYAVKAGYQDGRAVTAWSKGNGATQNDPDRQRWVNDTGVNYWVKRLAAKLGVELPADLAEPWQAPDFRAAAR